MVDGRALRIVDRLRPHARAPRATRCAAPGLSSDGMVARGREKKRSWLSREVWDGLPTVAGMCSFDSSF